MKLASKIPLVCVVLCLLAFPIWASTLMSVSTEKLTQDSAFVARVHVTAISYTEVAGFPHQVVHFEAREIFKGGGETGLEGSFAIPGGRKVGTDKVFAVVGGSNAFAAGYEYIVFLKDRPELHSANALRAESEPNLLVGWTALRVVNLGDGRRGLHQTGRWELRDPSNSALRYSEDERVRGYEDEVSKITQAAASEAN